MKNKKYESCQLTNYTHADVTVHAVNQRYQGYFSIDEYTLQHKLFSGQQSESFTREVFERGDAVVVMPYDKVNNKVLLIEQFRIGAINAPESPWLLEFVAGMFDHDESAIDVAIREAKEEANINIKESDLVPVMQYLSSPGGMSERIHLYLAHFDSHLVNCTKAHGLAEENEDIKLHLVSREQAITLLTENKITNASTIIGLQWLALNYMSL